MQQLSLSFENFNQLESAKQLRDYQKSAIAQILEALKENNQVALVLPTGAGKTFTVASLIKQLEPCIFLALVPRRKLQRQMRTEFFQQGINSRYVITAQSLNDEKIMKKYHNSLDYIILDECHQLRWWQTVERLIAANPQAKIIGLTATPDRLSSKEYFEDKFQHLIYPISFGELVNQGNLCNPRYFAYGSKLQFNELGINPESGEFLQPQLDKECEKHNFNENIVRNLKELGIENRKTIIFCASIPQSKKLTAMLSQAGIPTHHIDGNTPEKWQNQAILDCAEGRIAAISCAKLLIEGFDEPRIDTVVLATATNSRMALVQMCGRGSRWHPDKNGEFWVIDFGDNFARLSLGLKQRFPYKSRDDEFDKRKPPQKVCPECNTLNYAFVRVCKDCGFIFPKKIKPIQDLQDCDIVEVEADLADLYHIRQMRKIVRESYQQDVLPFTKITKYCFSKNLRIAQFFTAPCLRGCIFKHRSLENVLDFSLYLARHVARLGNRNFTNEEIKHLTVLKKLKTQELDSWIAVMSEMMVFEFGEKFLNSAMMKPFNKHHGKWYNILGVLEIADIATIESAYKDRWKKINQQILEATKSESEYLGEFNADTETVSIDKLDRNLQQEILLLDWAYSYVKLIYNK